MDPNDFAREFGALYRELYRLAVRRVADGREVLSAETTAGRERSGHYGKHSARHQP